MQYGLVFNICLDSERSLLKNLEFELVDCQIMIELFTNRHQTSDVSYYEKKKAYLEKLIKEVKNDR